MQYIDTGVHREFCMPEIAYTIHYKCSNKAQVHFILFLFLTCGDAKMHSTVMIELAAAMMEWCFFYIIFIENSFLRYCSFSLLDIHSTQFVDGSR